MKIENEKIEVPFALYEQSLTAYKRGQYNLAVELISKAIAANSQVPEFHNSLGVILDEQGRYVEAIESYRRAIQLKPNYVEAYNNLGIALRVQGEFNEAIECYQRAIKLRPESAELYSNLADVQRDLGQCSESIANYDKAIQFKPDCAPAHWNKSIALLLSGNFAEGWAEYKWRRNAGLKITTYPHHYRPEKAWDGSPFQGKRLLIHYEQGLGDTIQFVRYLPMAKSLGGTVILEVRKQLYNLCQNLNGVDELVTGSFDNKPDVMFDLHVSLMDLPCIFGTTLYTIPCNVPYIHAETEKLRVWKERLTVRPSRGHSAELSRSPHRRGARPGFKVGIVWAGSPVHGKDHTRSCSLEDFRPLAEIPNVQLYSLQKGPAAQQWKHTGYSMLEVERPSWPFFHGLVSRATQHVPRI